MDNIIVTNSTNKLRITLKQNSVNPDYAFCSDRFDNTIQQYEKQLTIYFLKLFSVWQAAIINPENTNTKQYLTKWDGKWRTTYYYKPKKQILGHNDNDKILLEVINEIISASYFGDVHITCIDY